MIFTILHETTSSQVHNHQQNYTLQDSCCLQDYGQLDNIMLQQQPYQQSLLYIATILENT